MMKIKIKDLAIILILSIMAVFVFLTSEIGMGNTYDECPYYKINVMGIKLFPTSCASRFTSLISIIEPFFSYIVNPFTMLALFVILEIKEGEI